MPWYGKSAHFAARTVPGSKKVNFLRYQYFAKLLITSKHHTPFNYVFSVQCTVYCSRRCHWIPAENQDIEFLCDSWFFFHKK